MMKRIRRCRGSRVATGRHPQDSPTPWRKMTKLKNNLKTMLQSKLGIQFNKFKEIMGSLHNVAIGIPGGRSLFSPINKISAIRSNKKVKVRRNAPLQSDILNWRALLKEASREPKKAKELVHSTMSYIGIVDLVQEGVGGVVLGYTKAVKVTVLWVEWLDHIQRLLLTEQNPAGTITNSDLKMAGLLILWLVIEAVASDLKHIHVALLNDNRPAISWIGRMASKLLTIAGMLLRALVLRMNIMKASSLTVIDIPGVHNKISDIPSRSFGYKKEWHCTSVTNFLNFSILIFRSQIRTPGNSLSFATTYVQEWLLSCRWRYQVCKSGEDYQKLKQVLEALATLLQSFESGSSA